MSSMVPLSKREMEADNQLGSPANAPLWIVSCILLLAVLLYLPTSLEIADLWNGGEGRPYSHGWLVLAITCWLIWRERVRLQSIAVQPPTAGWLLVAVGSAGWLVGLNSGLLAVTVLAMPLLMLAAVWAVCGAGVARRVGFALSYLYFALPVWDGINPLLQSLTANVNLWLTRMAGIPVKLDEWVIQIPAGSFEIAGGCSGLHIFTVALAIAALHGEIDRSDLRTRLLLLGTAGALGLLTNWVRVFVVILAGHLTDMQHFLIKVDHYYFGWFLFMLALWIYFRISSRIPRRGDVKRAATARPAVASRSRVIAAVTLTAAALSIGPAWSLTNSGRTASLADPEPPSIEGWSGPGLYLGDWRPVFENADEEFLVSYHDDASREVAIYLATYHSQRQGKELQGYGNSVLGPRYRETALENREVVVDGRRMRVSERHAQGVDGRELLVWSQFVVDGKPDALGIAGRLAYGFRSLVRFPTASVVAVAAECRPDCDAARESIRAPAVDVMSALHQGPEQSAYEDK